MSVEGRIIRVVVIIFATLICPTMAGAETVTFADETPGAVAKDFDHGVAGLGGPGRWEVVSDSTATGGKALAQLGTDATDHRFLTAFYKPFSAENVEVTVRFKAVAGKSDQAGGVVVRLVDAKNYYIARANALEDNVRFYRVKGSQRQQLATADVKVTAGVWHTLTLRAEGDQFTVLFDGNLMHATKDTTIFPRPAAGRVGVWVKSDSITYFDRIDIKALP
jgi:hypothetical protein